MKLDYVMMESTTATNSASDADLGLGITDVGGLFAPESTPERTLRIGLALMVFAGLCAILILRCVAVVVPPLDDALDAILSYRRT